MFHRFAHYKVHWYTALASLLATICFVGTVGQTLTATQPGWQFVVWWMLKTLVAGSVLLVPIMIGYHQDDHPQRQGTLLLIWLIGLVTFTWAHYTTQPVVNVSQRSPELYVVQQVFITWLLSTVLIWAAPYLHQLLRRWSISQRRRWLLIITGAFLILNFINGYDAFGFHQGNSLIWFGYLFAIGDWLANDQQWLRKWSPVRYGCLTGSLFLASSVVTWLNMNNVVYSPHSGLTPNTHYLLAINPYQPFMLITCILFMGWISTSAHQSSAVCQSSDLFQGVLTLNLLGLPMAFTPFLLAHFSWTKGLLISIVLWIVLQGVTVGVLRFSPHWQWSITIDQLNHYLLKMWRRYWPLLLTFMLLWLMTLISFALLWNGNWTMVQWVMTERIKIVLVNVAIAFAITIIIMAITNRWWIATGISVVVYAGWIVASMLKIAARNEPIIPTDLTTLAAPGAMLGMVSPSVIMIVILTLIVILVGAAWIEHRIGKSARFSLRGRLLTAVLAVAYLGSFSFANHSSSIIYKQLQNMDDIPYFYSQLRGAKLNGTLLQFANNVDVHTMNKPHGYSRATMMKIAQKYQRAGVSINRQRLHSSVDKQNLVFVLSESYSDPSRVPGLKIHGGDPIPYLHELKKHSTSGLMLSSGYGGGTANMEYQALTGLSIANFSPTMPTPYSQLVPYQRRAFAINQLFPYSIGIHPFTANLYSRKAVYRKFKFNKFYHFDGGSKITYTKKIQNSPRVSDDSAYREITLNLHRQPHGKFVQMATMQNHMPYNPSYYHHRQFKVTGKGFNNSDQQAQIETYIQGIHYTDAALRSWIKQLDAMKQPVTVVWYGDHLPGIYHGLPMGKYGVPLHETDYFIYSNAAARKLNRTKISHQYKLVSPNNFGALALEQMNVKVSPYFALLTKVAHDIPATSLPTNGTSKNNAAHQSGRDFVNDRGQHVHLTKQQQHLFHDYQLVQYDLIAGHHYLLHDSFLKDTAK